MVKVKTASDPITLISSQAMVREDLIASAVSTVNIDLSYILFIIRTILADLILQVSCKSKNIIFPVLNGNTTRFIATKPEALNHSVMSLQDVATAIMIIDN